MADSDKAPQAAASAAADKVATPKTKVATPRSRSNSSNKKQNKKPSADGAGAEQGPSPRRPQKKKAPAPSAAEGEGDTMPRPKKKPPKKKPLPGGDKSSLPQATEEAEGVSGEAAAPPSPKKKKSPKKKPPPKEATEKADGENAADADSAPAASPKKKKSKPKKPAAADAEAQEDAEESEPAEPASAADKIMKQVEFYFCESNLPSDKFLRTKLDSNQTVGMDTIMSFKRIKKLSADPDIVRDAINQSAIVQVSEGDRVGRIEPLVLEASREEVNDRTVVAQNLPADASIESLTELFSKVGLVRVVRVKHPGQEKDLDFQVNVRGGGSFAVVEYDTSELATKAAAQLTEKNNWRNGLLVARATKAIPVKKVKQERRFSIPSELDSATPVVFEEGLVEEGVVTNVKDNFAFAMPVIESAPAAVPDLATDTPAGLCGLYVQCEEGFTVRNVRSTAKTGCFSHCKAYTVFLHQGNLSKSQSDEMESLVKDLPQSRSHGYNKKGGKGGGKGKASQLWTLLTVGAKVSYTLFRNPDNQGPVGKDIKIVALSPNFQMPAKGTRSRSNSYNNQWSPEVPSGEERPRRLMLTKKKVEKGSGEIDTSGEGKQSVGPSRDEHGQVDRGFGGTFTRENISRGIKPKPEPEPEPAAEEAEVALAADAAEFVPAAAEKAAVVEGGGQFVGDY